MKHVLTYLLLIPLIMGMFWLAGPNSGLNGEPRSAESPAPAKQPAAEPNPAAGPVTRYDGRTLDEWLVEIKNIDFKLPQRAEYVPGLMAILQDPAAPEHAHRQAALALGQIGFPAKAAVPLLVARLERALATGAPPAVWVVKALGDFRADGRPAVQVLLKLMQDGNRSVAERRIPLDGLAELGAHDEAVLPALVELLQLPPARPGDAAGMERDVLREAAIDAVQTIGPDAAVTARC